VIGDAIKQSAPPSLEEPSIALSDLAALASGTRPRNNNVHSKSSVAWKNEDLNPPAFFQDLGGFSSVFWDSDSV